MYPLALRGIALSRHDALLILFFHRLSILSQYGLCVNFLLGKTPNISSWLAFLTQKSTAVNFRLILRNL